MESFEFLDTQAIILILTGSLCSVVKRIDDPDYYTLWAMCELGSFLLVWMRAFITI